MTGDAGSGERWARVRVDGRDELHASLGAARTGERAGEKAARRVARLGHPSLPPPRVEIERERATWIAVLPGAPLTAPLDEAGARALLRELGAALGALHAAGLTHGGLIWDAVRRDGERVILAGAGLALARRAGGDERDDVRDLGAVLYQALTGAPPFVVPADELPAALRPTLLRCLHADRERRWGTVAEVLAALGEAPPTAPRRAAAGPVVRAVLAIVLLAACAVGGWFAWQKIRAARDAAVPGAQRPTAKAAPVVAPPSAPARLVVGVTAAALTGLPAERAWLASGVRELLADELAAQDAHLEVSRGAARAQTARKAGVDLLVTPSLALEGDGVILEVRLLDLRGDALRLAERKRATTDEELLAATLALADVLARGALPPDAGAPRAPAPGVRPKVAAAWAAHATAQAALAAGDVRVAAEGFARAAALDPSWLPPRLALLELDPAALGDAAARVTLAAETAALAERAGGRWALRYAAATAAPGAPRIAALEALLAATPADVALAAQLVAAYRFAGRAQDCLRLGRRLVEADPDASAVRRDVAYCSLAHGESAQALEAARAYAKIVGPFGGQLTGEVLLAGGKFTAARDAWRAAADAGDPLAAGALPLVDALHRGRCAQATLAARTRVPGLAGDATTAAALAAAWALVALDCGDVWNAREAEVMARGRGADPALADVLALATAARRSPKGVVDRALAALAQPVLDERARQTLRRAALVAARAEKREQAVLDALGPLTPLDTMLVGGPPVALEHALTAIAAGAVEVAAADCAALAKTLGSWPPVAYCEGRVAEARGDFAAAFRAYRVFLDGWVDADEAHLWLRDVRRRLPGVIAKARAPKPAAP